MTVMVEGRSRSLPAGLTIAQVLERLELPAMAGDLLAVDHSMLRKGASPPPRVPAFLRGVGFARVQG